MSSYAFPQTQQHLAQQQSPVEFVAPLPLESDRQHLFSLRVGVAIPALQAVVSGLFGGLAVGSVSTLLRDGLAWWPDVNFWQSTGTAWALTQAGLWFGLVGRWVQLTAPIVEQQTGLDLNNDGQIGPPKSIRLELVTNQGRTTQYVDLPLDEAELTAIAQGLIKGVPFSESNWTGGGKLLSRRQFRNVRDQLTKFGLLTMANNKSRNQGFMLSKTGLELMRQFAAVSAAPSPTLRAVKP